MSVGLFLTVIALGFVASIGGCATSDRATADQQDPMLQKADDHPIHGEASVFYGHSVGR
jgi:hypothetical protein